MRHAVTAIVGAAFLVFLMARPETALTAAMLAAAYLAAIPPRRLMENVRGWLAVAASLWGGH